MVEVSGIFMKVFPEQSSTEVSLNRFSENASDDDDYCLAFNNEFK